METDCDRPVPQRPALAARTAAIAALLLACAAPRPAAAQCVPPANEACAGAITIPAQALPYETSGVYGCTNNIVDHPYFDTFYRFDPVCTGMYTVAMCGSTADASLRVYKNACGWFGGTEVAEGDDECAGSPPSADPRVDVLLFAGTAYWIETGTFRDVPPWAPSTPNAPFVLTVSACAPCGSGDVNGDGRVDGADIPGFVVRQLAPGPVADAASCASDMSQDGSVGFEDIAGFVDRLLEL